MSGDAFELSGGRAGGSRDEKGGLKKDMKIIGSSSPGPGGVVSLEPQPFLQRHGSAPKTQWVMVVAHWYGSSGWLEGLRLLWGRFTGKGAVGGMSPFPVADSPETTPPGPGLEVFSACCEERGLQDGCEKDQ